MKKLFIVMLCAFLAASALAGCSGPANATPVSPSDAQQSSGEKISLKMSTSTSDTSTWTIAANYFADQVAEKSNGQIEIKVYANDQLSGGNQTKGIEMMMSGSTDFTFHSNLVYSTVDDRFNVLSLPFLIKDEADADAKLAGPGGEELKKILDEKGIVGLGFGENGFRQVTNSKRPIYKVEDMKGLKFRINNSKMLIATYKAMGADPTSMNFSEVFTSLQQGAIDGQENPLDVIDSSKLYEVQSNISLWGCTYDTIILGMNKAKFESLSEEHQKLIIECAADACEYQKKINREKAAEQLERFQENGVAVVTRDEMDIDAFVAAVQSVYDEYEPIVSKELLDLFR